MPDGSSRDSAPESSRSQHPDLQTELAAAYSALEASRIREASLRNELEHRVRNAAAITRSVFLRTIDNAATLEDARSHFIGRLDALARYNARLAFGSAPFNLETMIWDELISMAAGSDGRIEVAGPDVGLLQSVAAMIGLALHELATNSVKFGVLGSLSQDARLTVRWEEEAERTIQLQWSETGIPIVAAEPIVQGFGRGFIENALPYQLDATTEFRLIPGGVMCRIQFPLDGRR